MSQRFKKVCFQVNGVSGEEADADNKVTDEGSDVKDVPMEGEETKS